MIRALAGLAVLCALAVGAGWVLTRPERADPSEIAGLAPDLARGEAVFHASGCASCHAAPGAETDDERLVLSGGTRLDTEFGVFVAPNISPHPEAGIGGWTRAEVVTALRHGTSPEGAHYYPAFPYSSYDKATTEDLVSLAAYLETLPPDPTPSAPHELTFPFNIRAGVGAWKLLNTGRDWVLDAGGDPVLERGRYLVEALGHCAECHTARDAFGGLETGRWMAGAPNPSGRGRIPNITPAALDWSEADIAAYLESGFTPDFDVAGGSMASVVRNTAKLTPEDRRAIARYLKALPPLD
jgi:mono/diheme cytochrome c family protein